MTAQRYARYPYHLGKLVAQRLRESNLAVPPERVLLRLFETLYFASLKTDEGRPCLCTINYVDPDAEAHGPEGGGPESHWTIVRFEQPLPWDVRTLVKLAEAAEPTASSLAVFCDKSGQLFIWGMVDQELRYGDYVALDSARDPKRPGLFQATITGIGNLCVYKDYALLSSLEQNTLIQQYHDVLWSGPVHALLRENLVSVLAEDLAPPLQKDHGEDKAEVERELLVRWQNAICRILLNIQQHRHGGGLLIAPSCPADEMNVKYVITYDRLPRALLGLVQHQLLKRLTIETIAQHCQHPSRDVLPCEFHFDAVDYQEQLERYKTVALGCVRFIASLSRVDGCVLLDKRLVAHGFGAELRAASDLSEVYVANDTLATPGLLRPVHVSQFGTRHRAMMRYCHQHAGSLGFVISQDGDIRAVMRVDDRLILWENINVQLAFKAENRGGTIRNLVPMMGLFQYWAHSLAGLGS